MWKAIGLGAVGLMAGATDFFKNGFELWRAANGPNSAAGRAAENAKQTEAFTSTTTGVGGFFVAIMDFFRQLSRTFADGNFGKLISGQMDIKGFYAGADNRAPDAKGDVLGMSPDAAMNVGLGVGEAVEEIRHSDAAKETLAMGAVGVAGGAVASKMMIGSIGGVFKNKWALAASAAAGVASSAALPEGLTSQVKNYASGLVSDALHKDNFTLKGAWDNVTNIANASAHGVTHGVGYVASFALANTVGLVTGHSTQDMHKDWVGWGIDKVYGATVGLPDLSGHWAHAVDNVASLAAPMGMAAKVAGNLSRAVGLTGRAEQATQAGVSVITPVGP